MTRIHMTLIHMTRTRIRLRTVRAHPCVDRYPGAACDIESYCYLPFLNRMGFAPSKKYVNAKEISEYLSQCVDTLGVRERYVLAFHLRARIHR